MYTWKIIRQMRDNLNILQEFEVVRIKIIHLVRRLSDIKVGTGWNFAWPCSMRVIYKDVSRSLPHRRAAARNEAQDGCGVRDEFV